RAAGRGDRLVPELLDRVCEAIANGLVVIDDQDRGHSREPMYTALRQARGRTWVRCRCAGPAREVHRAPVRALMSRGASNGLLMISAGIGGAISDRASVTQPARPIRPLRPVGARA